MTDRRPSARPRMQRDLAIVAACAGVASMVLAAFSAAWAGYAAALFLILLSLLWWAPPRP